MTNNTIMEVKRTDSIDSNVNNLSEENIQFSINGQLFLETLLMMIRGPTIKYCTEEKEETTKERKKLEDEINILEVEVNQDIMNIQVEKLHNLLEKKEQLTDIRKNKLDGVMLRSKCRYQDLGKNLQTTFSIQKMAITQVKS